MTNEQIASFIQEGGADDLKPVLWERVKHLMFKICGQYFGRYSERFTACGAELADLRQEMYPAFLKAVESFKPAENLAFTSYLNFHIVNACRELLGIRSGDNTKPLDNCTSLDIPLNTEDGSDITLAGLIEDETALQAYENALNGIEDEQTRKVLAAALDHLEKPLRDVIVLYYFEGLTQETIAKQAGVSGERIRQRKAKALQKLRSMPDVRMLREEQRIESGLHFSSTYYGEAYFTAQKKIHEILKRGSYLSYGQRQAIIYDCKMKSSAEYKKLYVECQAYKLIENCYS